MATTNGDTITPSPSRSLKIWIILGLIFVGIPLSLFFGYLVKGKNQLQKVQQEYRDTGYPISLEDLNDWYPTPIGDNAADLYRQAAQQIIYCSDWKPDKKLLAPFTREVHAGIEPGSPEDDTELIGQLLPYVGRGDLPELGERLDPALLALIQSYLQANQQSLKTIYQASTIEQCRYPIDFTKGFERYTSIYLGPLREEVNLLSMQALVNAHLAHTDMATRSLLTSYTIGQSLDREPDLVSYLVKIAIYTKALYETERTLNLTILSDNDLVKLSKVIDDLLKSDGFCRAMVGEYVWGNAIFDGQYKFSKADGVNLSLLKISGLYDRDHVAYLTVILGYIHAAQLPIGQKFSEFDRIEHDLVATMPRTRIISRMLLPALARSSLINDRTLVLTVVQKVGLAVERYRLRHNKLPETLTDLTLEFLDKLPDDPFTSKPLHYKILADGGFMVYSTGEDATDDGGQRKNSDGKEYEPGSDICFEVRR